MKAIIISIIIGLVLVVVAVSVAALSWYLTHKPTSTTIPATVPTTVPAAHLGSPAQITPPASNPACFRNVALKTLGAIARQSSVYVGSNATPDKAIDGNTNGMYSNGSIAHTNNDPQAWWEVKLPQPYNIAQIDIWNRTDCCSDRLKDFYIRWSMDGINYSSLHVADGSAAHTTYAINQQAQYVKIQLNGTNYLNIAEVQVWTCM
jgi:hypothetical protein